MALPLKSGADLYTQELLRARLHNFDGDLAEYGTGSIYFNTTSGLNTSDRIRYRGLTNWHSVANLEDIARLEEMIGNLDFAGSEDFIGITSRVAALEGNFTNGAAKDAVKFGGQLPSYYATQSAFSALQEKVNAFLDGDVDSDAVLENLKEIQTFLDSYDGATSLVDLLDAKADKSQLSGYLPLSGGTISATGFTPLKIKSTDLSAGCYIDFQEGKASVGYSSLGGAIMQSASSYILLKDNDGLYWNNSSKFLHSGNIRDYAFTPQTQIVNNTDADTLLTNGVYLNATGNGSGNSNFPSTYGILMTFTQDKNYSAQISVGNGSMHVRRKIDAWSDWKTIAFTDSDITGYAAGLKHSNGTVGAVLNSSSNVTIGNSDYAGSDYKLFVHGEGRVSGGLSCIGLCGTRPTLGSAPSSGFIVDAYGKNTYGLSVWIENSGPSFIQSGRFDGDATAYALNLQPLGGVVSVGGRLLVNGATDDGVSALQVNGPSKLGGILTLPIYHQIQWGDSGSMIYASATAMDLIAPIAYFSNDVHVRGNLIVDGQVSSGGVAEEGTGVGGSLERVTFTIPSGTTSFECEHNLGTKEISVSIYEEGGDYQQILADVYLDSTNIARIVFGRATDVAHKVVIIG